MGSGGKSQKTDTSFTRQLAGLSNRLESESRPIRQELLGQIMAILTGGLNAFGGAVTGNGAPAGAVSGGGTSAAPATFTRADLSTLYGFSDPDKALDINRITKGLGDSFTLDQLKGGANLKGLSARSQSAFTNVLSDLESKAKSGGSNLGGISGGAGQAAGRAAGFLPIIQSALEQSRLATSRSLQDTEAELAGSKIGGTPFGERVLADTRLQGDIATGQIPANFALALLQQFVPLAFGQSSTAVQGLSSAAGIQGSLQAGVNANNANQFSALVSSLGQLGGAVGKSFGRRP